MARPNSSYRANGKRWQYFDKPAAVYWPDYRPMSESERRYLAGNKTETINKVLSPGAHDPGVATVDNHRVATLQDVAATLEALNAPCPTREYPIGTGAPLDAVCVTDDEAAAIKREQQLAKRRERDRARRAAAKLATT